MIKNKVHVVLFAIAVVCCSLFFVCPILDGYKKDVFGEESTEKSGTKYSITYYVDDDEYIKNEYSVGEKVNSVAVPVKKGYCGAWDSEEPEIMTDKDVVLNAVYTAETYTITFNTYDGKLVEMVEYSIENPVFLEPIVPERLGYTGSWSEYDLEEYKNQTVVAEYVKGIDYVDDFQGAKDLGINAYEINNLVSDRGGHVDWGAVPGSAWGGYVSGGNASITYLVKADSGDIFSNLRFEFTCKYGNTKGYYYNEETGKVGANTFLKISFDNEHWQTVYNINEDLSLTKDGVNPITVRVDGWANKLPEYTPDIDLTSYVSGHKEVYIKLEIMHYDMEGFNAANGKSNTSGILLQDLGFLLYGTEIIGETSKGLMMNQGAAVKITSGEAGLRFTTNIPKDFYESLLSQGYTVSAKTIIMPYAYVKTYGDISYNTVFGEDAVYYVGSSSKAKIKVNQVSGEIEYDGDKECYYFRGVLDNVTDKDSATEYIARGYIVYEKDGEKYYDFAIYNNYEQKNNVRSMEMVALSAYNDQNSGLTQVERGILKSSYKFLQQYDLTNLKITGKYAVYDGEVHRIGIEGLPNGVVATFSNNDNVNAGQHIVTITFAVQNGYYTIASRSETLTIEKRLLEIEFIGETVLEYTGEAQKTLSAEAVNLIGNDKVSLSIEYSGDMVDLGSYTATCVLKDNANYALKYGNTKTVTITRKGNLTGFFNVSNWCDADGNAHQKIENTKNGLEYYGGGYCKLPLDISSGLKLEFDLSALPEKMLDGGSDHWFGFGLGQSAAYGSYDGTKTNGSILVMISKEYGLYTVRMQYIDVDGNRRGLTTQTFEDDYLVFEIEKLNDNTIYTDNVDVYINHVKIDNAVVDRIALYSTLMDSEGNTYLSIASHGSEQAKKTGVIKYIGIRDSVAPEITFSRDFRENISVGEYVVLPKINVSDTEEFQYTTYLYSPSGKTIENTFSAERAFLPEEEGTYTLAVKAIDVSGNDAFIYKQFTVGERKTQIEFASGTSSTELPDYVDELSGEWLERFLSNTKTDDGFNQGLIKSSYYTASVTDYKGNVVNVHVYAAPYSSTNVHSFGYIDTDKDCFPLKIKVVANYDLESAFVIPEVFGIKATVKNNTVEFVVNDFETYNVFFNGKFNTEKPFTLFVRENFNETVPNGYNVIEFDKGVHFITSLNVTSNTVVYLHTGAYVVCLPHQEGEVAYENSFGNKVYSTMIAFSSMQNVAIMGHGVFDYSLLYRHERATINMSNSQNLYVNGPTMVNATGWTLVFTLCDNVHVKNVIGFGVKTNSDGIATCNSKNVLVEDCFLRSGDDLFEIKANVDKKDVAEGVDASVQNVVYRNCQAWAEKTRSFGFIQETCANVSNVKYINCHSLVQNAVWAEATGKYSMGAYMVLVGDTETVSDIEFIDCTSYCCAGYVVNISVEHNEWTYDTSAGFGTIHDITFKNFSYYKEPDGYGAYSSGGSTPISSDIRLYNETDDVSHFYNISFINLYRNGALANSLEDLKIDYTNVSPTDNNVVYRVK